MKPKRVRIHIPRELRPYTKGQRYIWRNITPDKNGAIAFAYGFTLYVRFWFGQTFMVRGYYKHGSLEYPAVSLA